jgi:hypothetical protein
MVFFQWAHADAHKVVRAHMQQHVKCLREFFDVTVIARDCDYLRVCDEFQPDVVLFEAGVRYETSRRIRISNVGANAGVFKIGLHNGDPWCDCRAGFLSDMEQWGVEDFITIAAGTAEHTPEIADRLFVWPNAIDPETFRDYGLPKTIPVMMTGRVSSLYPWRQRIGRVIAEHYPSLICPHPGYGGSDRVFSWHGQEYARMINASSFVPTCGTVAKELLRKHLEIPACRTCLITERSEVLEAAGFVDMQNCVFADGADVIDKVGDLLRDQARLADLTDAGFRLVHAEHTIRQRDQVLQLYLLQRARKPGERVVQSGPFGALRLAPKREADGGLHLAANGRHLQLLAAGDARLQMGDVTGAETSYLRALTYIPWWPEPMLKLALCALHKGDARSALEWLRQPLARTLDLYGARDPDPIEWAYSIVALLCAGKPTEAARRANQFPWLLHPELERARWLARVLHSGIAEPPPRDSSLVRTRPSLHRVARRDIAEWTRQAARFLEACGQQNFVASLKTLPFNAVRKKRQNQVSSGDSKTESAETSSERSRAVMSPGPLFSRGLSRPQGFRIPRRIKRAVRRSLGRAEERFGAFLPYHLSDMQARDVHRDEFYSELKNLVREEDSSSAMLIGASAGQGATEALLSELEGNPRLKTILLLNRSTPAFVELRSRVQANRRCRWLPLPSASASRDLQSVFGSLGVTIDLIWVDGSQFGDEIIDALPESCGVLAIEHINREAGFRIHERMLSDKSFRLVWLNNELRDGCAVFRRICSRPPAIPSLFQSTLDLARERAAINQNNSATARATW